MDFGDAIRALKGGARVTRAGWNGPGQWVELTAESWLPSPDYARYLQIHNAQGVFVPWLASQGDLLATDWQELSPAAM